MWATVGLDMEGWQKIPYIEGHGTPAGPLGVHAGAEKALAGPTAGHLPRVRWADRRDRGLGARTFHLLDLLNSRRKPTLGAGGIGRLWRNAAELAPDLPTGQ